MVEVSGRELRSILSISFKHTGQEIWTGNGVTGSSWIKDVCIR